MDKPELGRPAASNRVPATSVMRSVNVMTSSGGSSRGRISNGRSVMSRPFAVTDFMHPRRALIGTDDAAEAGNLVRSRHHTREPERALGVGRRGRHGDRYGGTGPRLPRRHQARAIVVDVCRRLTRSALEGEPACDRHPGLEAHFDAREVLARDVDFRHRPQRARRRAAPPASRGASRAGAAPARGDHVRARSDAGGHETSVDDRGAGQPSKEHVPDDGLRKDASLAPRSRGGRPDRRPCPRCAPSAPSEARSRSPCVPRPRSN